jgi:ribosomal protein S2
MQPYLYAERSGIYIIDLEQSLTGIEEAYRFAYELARKGGTMLFVGTKKQAQEPVEEQATRVGMPFVNTRWLGGMLTNFQTSSRRLVRHDDWSIDICLRRSDRHPHGRSEVHQPNRNGLHPGCVGRRVVEG